LKKFLVDGLMRKQEEIEQLQLELGDNTTVKNYFNVNKFTQMYNLYDYYFKEFKKQYNNVQSQIEYLESNEDQIKQTLTQLHQENLERILIDQQMKRKLLSDEQDQVKKNRLLEYNIKTKEIDWLLELYRYSEGEELEKIKLKKAEHELDYEQWLLTFENECIRQDKILDEKEQEQDEINERKNKLVMDKSRNGTPEPERSVKIRNGQAFF
jgi:hypothetical protein